MRFALETGEEMLEKGARRTVMPFQEYSPEQAALLPLHVRDVLSEEHLVFLVSAVVDKQDLREWEAAYSEEGQRPYHPALLLKVLLYGFALGVRASRKIEQRIKEDLGFRYLAGGAEPDHKTICEFLRRHGRRINDLFTAVLEQLQAAGLVKLGVMALDSTRVKANASRDRVMSEAGLRAERARKRRQVRKWQRELATMDCDENPGGTVVEMHAVQQRLAEIPGELQKLRKSGQKRLSRTDADSRFLHSRDGFVLGYTAEAAVSEDGLIVAARVTQAANDHASLVPLVDQTEQRCGQRPQKVLADAGFYSNQNVQAMEQRGVELYVPDSVLAREMKQNRAVRGAMRISYPGLKRMRQRLRSPAGRRLYERRKGLIEPVFGTLKEHRGMRRFYRRGLTSVTAEFLLMALAFNLTRLHARRG
jgi:transposase